MEIQKLDKATSDKISFIAFIVPEFAKTYKMNIQDAYFYLKKYGGWDFLRKHWWALHTDNDIWALHTIHQICYKNGKEFAQEVKKTSSTSRRREKAQESLKRDE